MPVHPKVLAELRKRNLTTTTDNKGNPVELKNDDLVLQMLPGLGMGSRNQKTWFELIQMSKDQGKPLDEHVAGVKRVLGPDGKDYVLASYVISGVHYNGKPVSDSWREWGFYELPRFAKKYDGFRNKWVEDTNEFIDSLPVYEFPWEGKDTKITSPLTGKEMPIDSLIKESTGFFIITTGAIKLKVSRTDWLTKSRDELISIYSKPTHMAVMDNLVHAIAEAQRLVQK